MMHIRRGAYYLDPQLLGKNTFKKDLNQQMFNTLVHALSKHMLTDKNNFRSTPTLNLWYHFYNTYILHCYKHFLFRGSKALSLTLKFQYYVEHAPHK